MIKFCHLFVLETTMWDIFKEIHNKIMYMWRENIRILKWFQKYACDMIIKFPSNFNFNEPSFLWCVY